MRVEWIALALAAACLLLNGCAKPLAVRGGGRDPRGRIGVPESFSGDGAAFEPARRWWRSFGDPGLERVVDAVLEGSPTLDEALARRRRFRAVMNGVRAEDALRIGVTPGASRRFVDDSVRDRDVRATLEATASWEMDLWGRVEARERAARMDLGAARADARAAAVSAAGDAASAWYRYVAAEALGRIARRRVDPLRRRVYAARRTFSQGVSTGADLRRARDWLEDARSRAAEARAATARGRHAVNVLAGRGSGLNEGKARRRVRPGGAAAVAALACGAAMFAGAR